MIFFNRKKKIIEAQKILIARLKDENIKLEAKVKKLQKKNSSLMKQVRDLRGY